MADITKLSFKKLASLTNEERRQSYIDTLYEKGERKVSKEFLGARYDNALEAQKKYLKDNPEAAASLAQYIYERFMLEELNESTAN
jgi:hypothetical protein